VAEARQAMVALNEKNSETGRAPLHYGEPFPQGTRTRQTVTTSERRSRWLLVPATKLGTLKDR
jgi:hypothetical protein